MLKKFFNDSKKEELSNELFLSRKANIRLLEENNILKSFVSSLVPSYDTNDLNEELFLIKSKEVNIKEFKNTIKHLTDELMLSKNRIIQQQELIDEQEETITTLRSKIRNKVIEEEVSQKVNFYKSEILLLDEMNSSYVKKINDLLKKLESDDFQLSLAYEKALNNVKDIALSVATNSKPQLVVPELSISKED